MMHPSTELRSIDTRIGVGVFATALLPRGTITWAQDDLDQVFTQERAAALGKLYQPFLDRYAYIDGTDHVLLCWDHGRFVNHSCEANCLSMGWSDFEIAVRDIQPGEQITDDYGTLNVNGDFDCLCGAKTCRKRVLSDDLLRHSPEWDAIVIPAARLIREVEQPLWKVVRSRETVERAVRGEIPFPSVRENYQPRK